MEIDESCSKSLPAAFSMMLNTREFLPRNADS